MTTREETIRLAREADAAVFLAPYYIAAIERLIQLVRDGEAERLRQAKNDAYREAAKVCEGISNTVHDERMICAIDCEAAILALVKE